MALTLWPLWLCQYPRYWQTHKIKFANFAYLRMSNYCFMFCFIDLLLKTIFFLEIFQWFQILPFPTSMKPMTIIIATPNSLAAVNTFCMITAHRTLAQFTMVIITAKKSKISKLFHFNFYWLGIKNFIFIKNIFLLK